LEFRLVNKSIYKIKLDSLYLKFYHFYNKKTVFINHRTYLH